MRPAGLAALALLALALAGCQSSQEKNARLERGAKAREATLHLNDKPLDGLSVARESAKVSVVSSALLQGSEGDAAVVEVRNRSAKPLREVPIEITVHSASGGSAYTNATPGLARSLVSIALLGPHASVYWVDDQVQTSGKPAGLQVRIGEGKSASGSIPQLTTRGHTLQDPASGLEFEGDVVNESVVEQPEVVVACIARRAGRIVAAGRAVIAAAPAHSSSHFQVFFVGAAQGAQLTTSAVATRTS